MNLQGWLFRPVSILKDVLFGSLGHLHFALLPPPSAPPRHGQSHGAGATAYLPAHAGTPP